MAELCGGNIIKVGEDVKDGEQDDIRTISHLAVGEPCPARLLPCTADQSARLSSKGKRGLKYANPQDKYILILLEYKLMPRSGRALDSIGAFLFSLPEGRKGG